MISINLYEIAMQALNFGLLLWLMNKFLIKPLSSYLQERSSKIENDVNQAQDSKEKAEVLMREQKELLKQARLEARDIREKTEVASKKEHDDIIAKTKEEAKQLIQQAKKEIGLDVVRAKKELLSHTGDMVVTLSERVLTKKLGDQEKRDLVDQSIRKLQAT